MQPINFFNAKVINVGLVIQINIRDRTLRPRLQSLRLLHFDRLMTFVIFEDAPQTEQTALSRTLKASKLLYPMKAFGCRERPLESTS